MKHALKNSISAILVGLTATVASAEHYPQIIDSACRGGNAKLYDECGSQFAVLEAATKSANETGKIVMVVYGAEWCIWCHVFAEYTAGRSKRFEYEVEGDFIPMLENPDPDIALAPDLAEFFDNTFVVAHIESQYSPDGRDVLEAVGASEHYGFMLPFIFILKDGQFAAAMKNTHELPELEKRREGLFMFRGYDRAVLLEELRRLADVARP